jgi:hypothetical protein
LRKEEISGDLPIFYELFLALAALVIGWLIFRKRKEGQE